MADENEATNIIDAPQWEHVAPTADDHPLSDDRKDRSYELNDTVRGLPSNAAKELLSQGVRFCSW